MSNDTIERARRAWEAASTDVQPSFDNLEESYREGLITRTERVIADRTAPDTDDIFARFERYVLEELVPERFHPDNPNTAPKAKAAPIPDDEPKPKSAPKKVAPKPTIVKKGKK